MWPHQAEREDMVHRELTRRKGTFVVGPLFSECLGLAIPLDRARLSLWPTRIGMERLSRVCRLPPFSTLSSLQSPRWFLVRLPYDLGHLIMHANLVDRLVSRDRQRKIPYIAALLLSVAHCTLYKTWTRRRWGDRWAKLSSPPSTGNGIYA
jgi:hypothetical protein